jgi:hypothetical protein
MPPPYFLKTGIFPRFNTRVTSAAMNEPRSESSLVVDPRNPNRLLGVSKHFYDPQKYIFSIGAVFSQDGGDTWEDLPAFPIPVNHIIYTDPSATFGTPTAPGTASPAWVMGDPGFSRFKIVDGPDLFEFFECAKHGQGNQDILTSQMLAQASTNDGATWTEHEVSPMRCTGDDKGWIACDNSTLVTGPPKKKPLSPYHGRLYAVWAAETPMRFARSLDHGKTWIGAGSSKPGDDIGLQTTEGPDISIARDGTVHLFAHGPLTSAIDYLWSTDGGETFQGDGTFVADAIGDIHKNVDGQNIKWAGSPTQWPVFDGANFRVITIVSSCCFGSSGIIVAWADARSGHSRIYYRLSNDNGATWEGDPGGTPLLPELEGDDSHQFHPQLATTGNGVIGCAMYSYSKTARAGNKPGVDVLVAGSFDNGATWELKTVTEQPWDPAVNAPWSHGDKKVTFIGEYFGFDAGAKEFHVLWTDTRDGNQDLYYCRVDTEDYTSPSKTILAEIEATYMSPGVPRDGGGFVIVNGHVIRIPPYDPLRPVLDAVIAVKTTSEIGRVDTTRAKQALYDVMINAAKLAKRNLTEK